MLPADIKQLGDLTQTMTVVFLLTVAVLMLWRKWGEERKAREDDDHRHEQQMDELRKGFDRNQQEMLNDYMNDMRYLAGTKDASWGIPRPPHPAVSPHTIGESGTSSL